uniref:Uncharacterized protein n=1 Tax=uncultured prokaryote TaxID=198431 RepID=A0A0H5Q355_9ZZZZ|nr:hypothetical protein [uncultured prokaryote]
MTEKMILLPLPLSSATEMAQILFEQENSQSLAVELFDAISDALCG